MFRKGNFKKNTKAFGELLSTLNIDTVSPEIYCKKYLSYLLEHKQYFLEIYADVLQKLVKHSLKNKEEISLIDFGAGNGLLGIFAKYCGFKKVYINDIDKAFVDSAKALAIQLNIDIDGFIYGDTTALTNYFKNEKPDGIVGTDVIEHIYDLDVFFTTLKKLNPLIVSIFTTASNPNNFFKIRRLKKLQWKDEYFGGKPEESELFGATAHKAYLKIREDIIRDHFTLPEETIKSFAIATRGLIQQDIIKVTSKSLIRGDLPQPLAHPTNTCNPLTGSWTERILTINEYTKIYKNAGFKLCLYEGFYDEHKSNAKWLINSFLNVGIKILGKNLAPYIILTGTKV